MKVLSILLLVSVMMGLLVLASAPAGAQQYPNVANLQPFSPQANYMSLPGYLRWQVFRDTGTWLSREEATRIVAEQGGRV